MPRACLDVVASELRSRRHSPLARGTIKALACDALWCKDRAIALGYNVSSQCELCQDVDDSPIHRLWKCDCCKYEREEIVPPRVWRLLADADLSDPNKSFCGRVGFVSTLGTPGPDPAVVMGSRLPGTTMLCNPPTSRGTCSWMDLLIST